MVDITHYPKRDITVEPFSNQIDVIEKTLIEIENQPHKQYTYMNQNSMRPQKNTSFIPTNTYQLPKVAPTASASQWNSTMDISLNGQPDAFLNVLSLPHTSTQLPIVQNVSPTSATHLAISSTFDPFQPTTLKNDSQFTHGPFSAYLSGSLSSTATSSSIWGNNDSYRGISDAAVWG